MIFRKLRGIRLPRDIPSQGKREENRALMSSSACARKKDGASGDLRHQSATKMTLYPSHRHGRAAGCPGDTGRSNLSQGKFTSLSLRLDISVERGVYEDLQHDEGMNLRRASACVAL